MEEIKNDILFFNRILPEYMCQNLNLLVDTNYDLIFNRDLRYATFPFE